MKLLLKGFRNGLGGIIAFFSWIIPTGKVKRSREAQQQVDVQTQNIELYQFFGCPFCIKTRRAIRRLNLNIVTRDAQDRQGAYRAELLKETGKTQVPCLKITDGDTVEWMLETNQIIDYLDKRFA